jgi:peptidyl-prolyl cis-trans isomerase SurA
MNRYRLVPFFLCAVFLATAVYAEVTNRIVAIVNNDVISLYDLDKESQPLTDRIKAMYHGSDVKSQIYKARREILEQMINRLIAKEEIERLGINVGDDEINNAIERIKQDNSLTQEEFLARVQQEDKTLDEVRNDIKSDLEQAKLMDREVRSRVVISEEQMKQYYENNKDEFVGKNRVRLKNILIAVSNNDPADVVKAKRELAYKLEGEIKSGASFDELARTHSSGPGASKGGDLGYMEWNDLAPYLKEAIEKLKPGQITDVLETPYGFQIIMLAEREDTGVKTFDEVKKQIQEKLYQEQLRKKYERYVQGLRDKAFIKIQY